MKHTLSALECSIKGDDLNNRQWEATKLALTNLQNLICMPTNYHKNWTTVDGTPSQIPALSLLNLTLGSWGDIKCCTVPSTSPMHLQM